jgi:hypothetical protein
MISDTAKRGLDIRCRMLAYRRNIRSAVEEEEPEG